MAAHELGYLAAGGSPGPSHSYVAVVAPLVVVAVCVAGWSAAVRLLRRDAGRAPSFGTLTSIQLGLFLLIEVGERVASGSLDTIGSAPVAVGLVLQPIVAAAALDLLRVGRCVVEAVFAVAGERPPACPLTAPFSPVSLASSGGAPALVRPRGPPQG